MVVIKDIYLTGEELFSLQDKTAEIVKGSQYKMLLLPDGKERESLVTPVRISNGAVRDWIVNKTCQKKLILKFGSETDAWIGKKIKLVVNEQNVRGTMRKVIFVE